MTFKLSTALRNPLVATFLSLALGSSAAHDRPAENPDGPTPAMQPMEAGDIHTESVHGIPMRDAMMATYAAYYVGANKQDPTLAPIGKGNTDLDGRATNTFGMTPALDQYFGQTNSPFLVLDDSNRWNERHDRVSLQRQRDKMGGGYFVTLYHKDSGRIMIVAPGLEGDTPGSGTNNISQNFMGLASRGVNDYGDVLFNAEDTYKGSTFLRMTRAMHEYIGELDSDLKAGSIHVVDGSRTKALEYTGGETIKDKLVLAGHSAGTIPAQTLTGLGYRSFLVEPRAYNANLEHRMLRNLAYMGESVDPATIRSNLQSGQSSIRASWGNVWTSGLSLNGEFHSNAPGTNYVAHRIGTEVDTMIAGTHREEVMTPGLLGMTGAKGYKGPIVLILNAVPGQAARTFGETIAPTVVQSAGGRPAAPTPATR